MGIGRLLHENFDRVSKNHPSFKEIFPAAPMVAFRRVRNIKDTLVKSTCERVTHPQRGPRSMIEKNMNKGDSVTVDTKSFKIVKESSRTKGVVYCAECTKCHKKYVGSTGRKLSDRFNGHRSDIVCYPDRCELPKHFAESPSCSFENDLVISILERVIPTKLRLEREQVWIQKLSTEVPLGLNSKCSEITTLHKSLHRC